MLLERYTWQTLQSKGLLHQRYLAILRNYLKTTPIADLEFAIRRITKIEELKTLWEAGLSAELQKIVLRRYEELTGRREI